MKSIRRFYFYLVAFISIEVVLWGLVGLLRSVVDDTISGGADALAQALALILVADGDVDIDEPLRAQLPEFGAGRKVTLRQLLSHTSGLASDAPEEDREESDRARWIARHCREADLTHPPETVFSYSNVGYVVIGRLVEVVTDMAWQEALEAGVAPPVVLEATHISALEFVTLEELQAHALTE